MSDSGTESFQKYIQASKDILNSQPVEIQSSQYCELITNTWERLDPHDKDPDIYGYMIHVLPHHQFSKEVHFSLNITDSDNFFKKGDTSEYTKSSRPIEDNRHWDTFSDEPTLKIRNLTTFMKKLAEFKTTCLLNKEHLAPWFSIDKNRTIGDEIDLVWYHAAPTDFVEPEKYLDRMINFVNDRTFEDLTEKPRDIPEAIKGRTLRIVRYTPNSGMETPDELRFSLFPNDMNSLAQANSLPTVRYGIDNNKACIYAVQNPKIYQDTQEELDRYKSLFTEGTNDTQNYFIEIRKKFPNDFKKIFGEVPEEIFIVKNGADFVTQFNDYLLNTFPGLGTQINIFEWTLERSDYKFTSPEDHKNSIHNKLIEELGHVFEWVKDGKELAEDQIKIDSRKNLLRNMYKLDEGIQADTEYNLYKNTANKSDGNEGKDTPEYPEENVHDIYRPAILSITASIALFKNKGITDIAVPTYLPLRWISHTISPVYSYNAESIQRNISNGLVRLFRRIEEQVDGVSITKLPDDDGIMHIKINDKKDLDSKNPMLHEFLQNLNKNLV